MWRFSGSRSIFGSNGQISPRYQRYRRSSASELSLEGASELSLEGASELSLEGASERPVSKTAWGIFMIKLTRLDGEQFVLNADLIRYVERRPDTFITLTSGDRIVVAESMDEVVERAVRYQQQKHFLPLPAASLPKQHLDSSPSTPTSIQ